MATPCNEARVLFLTDALVVLRVEHVATPTGRRLIGTLLARVAPRSADSGAAQRSCTDDAGQLSTTHVLRDLRETRTCPSVCINRTTDWSIGTVHAVKLRLYRLIDRYPRLLSIITNQCEGPTR